jgi:hypothetical protein
MSEWRPIETAPKDGSAMLLYADTEYRYYSVADIAPGIVIGFWMHGRWESIETQDCGSMGGEETGWMSDICPFDVSPTHWMPLPEAPK